MKKLKFKHVFWGIVFVLGLSFLFLPNTSLAAEKSKIVTLEQENNELTITINKQADFYKIYKNEVLVYEGTNNIYKDKMDDGLEKYKVGIFNKNKLVKVISLKAVNNSKKEVLPDSAKHNEDEISKIVRSTSLQTNVSDTSVELQWPKLPDQDGIYEIYRDNQKIAETKELSYTDTDVIPNTQYTYTLKIDNKLSKEKENEIKEKLKENNIKPTKEEKKEIFSNTGTISTLINTTDNTETSLKKDELIDKITKPAMNSNDAIKSNDIYAQLLSLPNENMFGVLYNTFIPYKSVQNPAHLISKYNYLQGDNRSFSVTSTKYRTQSNVNLMFNYPTSITLWKDVSPSHACADATCANPTLIGTASTSGITMTKYSVSSTKLSWDVTHSVGVPIADYYPNIDYYYLATLTPTSFKIAGNHDKAPNHEVYLTYPSGTGYITLHRFAVSSPDDFINLLGITTSWSFEI